MTKILALTSAFVGLTACQDLRWENASVPESQWEADRSSCAAFARNLSQRRLSARPSYVEQWRPGPEGEAVRRREDDLARREAADDTAALDDCMRRKGYERVAR
jgi:hypothetical protein